MDGENHGIPYEQMDDFGGKTHHFWKHPHVTLFEIVHNLPMTPHHIWAGQTAHSDAVDHFQTSGSTEVRRQQPMRFVEKKLDTEDE